MREITDINLEKSGSKSGDYRHKSGEIRLKIGRSQTLIWRPGDMVQNLETPGLSGRVDSPAVGRRERGGMNLFQNYTIL